LRHIRSTFFNDLKIPIKKSSVKNRLPNFNENFLIRFRIFMEFSKMSSRIANGKMVNVNSSFLSFYLFLLDNQKLKFIKLLIFLIDFNNNYNFNFYTYTRYK